MMAKIMRCCCAPLALWLMTLAAPVQSQTTIALDDALNVATGALNRGAPNVAKEIVDALLVLDPGDVEALLILSRSDNALGNHAGAAEAGKRAWRGANSDEQKYEAALAIAQALSAAGARTRAQLWLRRAANVAPNPMLKALAVRDFRYVRARNPWSTDLHFAVSPSSNVNGGSRSDIMIIDGLPFVLSGDARALSGIKYRYGGKTGYSSRLTPSLTLNFGASFDANDYTLSSAAKAQAPDLAASQLAYREVQLTFGVTRTARPGAGPVDLALALGKAWSGGQLLSDFAQLRLSKTVQFGARTQGHVEISTEQQWRKDASLNSSTAIGGLVGWSRRRENGDLFQLSLELQNTISDGPDIANDAVAASFSYNLARPIAGALISFSVGYEERRYKVPLYSADPRADHNVTMQMTAFLPDWAYYGFAPEIGLSATQTNSNVALYELRDYGLSLGFRSAF